MKFKILILVVFFSAFATICKADSMEHLGRMIQNLAGWILILIVNYILLVSKKGSLWILFSSALAFYWIRNDYIFYSRDVTSSGYIMYMTFLVLNIITFLLGLLLLRKIVIGRKKTIKDNVNNSN